MSITNLLNVKRVNLIYPQISYHIMLAYTEIDKLLFKYLPNYFFWNPQLYIKQRLSKIIGINEYPIRSVDVA